MKALASLVLLLLTALPPLQAAGEYEWRFFTRIRDSRKEEVLPKTITAEIKIVSRIDENRFKAIVRKGPDDEEKKQPFVLYANDFSPDDQAFLKQWDPNLAIDLSTYPIKVILERSGYQKVPLPHVGDKFEVHAKINGKPVCFILDTGAETTILSIEAAERLGIDQGTQIGRAAGISGVPTPLYETMIESFHLGDIKTNEQSIKYSKMGMGTKYDGLFGFDYINALQGIIDYRDGGLYIKVEEKK